MLARSALLLGVKIICVAHNNAHAVVLQKLLLEFIVKAIKENNHMLSPADKETRLKEAKPARLVAWLAQKGRANKRAVETTDPNEAKRAKLAVSLDSMLTAMLTTPKAKDKGEDKTIVLKDKPEEPATPKPKAAVVATPSPAPKAPSPSGPPDVAALLKQWG